MNIYHMHELLGRYADAVVLSSEGGAQIVSGDM